MIKNNNKELKPYLDCLVDPSSHGANRPFIYCLKMLTIEQYTQTIFF